MNSKHYRDSPQAEFTGNGLKYPVVDKLISLLEDFRIRIFRLMYAMYNFNIKENDFLRRNFKSSIVDEDEKSIFEWNRTDIYKSLKQFIEQGINLFKDNKTTKILFKPFDFFFEETIFISISNFMSSAPKANKLRENKEIQTHGIFLKNLFQKIDEDFPQNSLNFLTLKETRKQKEMRGETNRTIIQSKMGDLVANHNRSKESPGDIKLGKHYEFKALNIPEFYLKELFYSQLLKLHVEFAPLINSKYFRFKALIDNAEFAIYFGLRDTSQRSLERSSNYNNDTNQEKNQVVSKESHFKEAHEIDTEVKRRSQKEPFNKYAAEVSKQKSQIPRLSQFAQANDDPGRSEIQAFNSKTERVFRSRSRIVLEARNKWKEKIAEKIHGLLVVDCTSRELKILCVMGFHPKFYTCVIKRAIAMLQSQFPEKPIKMSLVNNQSSSFFILLNKLKCRPFILVQIEFSGSDLIYHLRSEDDSQLYLNPTCKTDRDNLGYLSSTKNNVLINLDMVSRNQMNPLKQSQLSSNVAQSFNFTNKNYAISTRNRNEMQRESLMHLTDRTDQIKRNNGISLNAPSHQSNLNFQSNKWVSVQISEGQAENKEDVINQSRQIDEQSKNNKLQVEFPFKSMDSHKIKVKVDWMFIETQDPQLELIQASNDDSSMVLVDFQVLSLLSFSRLKKKIPPVSVFKGFIWNQLIDRLPFHNFTLDEVHPKRIHQTIVSNSQELKSTKMDEVKEKMKSFFKNSLENFTLAIGSLDQNLRLSHCFYVLLEGKKYLRVSPGRKITWFKGRKFDFELFVVATEVEDTFVYFLETAALFEDNTLTNDKDFSKLIVEIFQDIDYSSAEQPKKALYVHPFRVNFTKNLESSLFDFSDLAEIEANSKRSNTPNLEPRIYASTHRYPEKSKSIHSKINSVFYKQSPTKVRGGSMADLESFKEINEILPKIAHHSKPLNLVEASKPEAQKKEGKSKPAKIAAAFKFDIDFRGRLAKNGLIYKPTSNCKILRKPFILGILHSDVEQLFLHPTLSLLVGSDSSSPRI